MWFPSKSTTGYLNSALNLPAFVNVTMLEAKKLAISGNKGEALKN